MSTKKKPKPKPVKKKQQKKGKNKAGHKHGKVAPSLALGDLLSPEEVAAADSQIHVYRETLRVERAWARIEAEREALKRDGLLGVPLDRLKASWQTVLTRELALELAQHVRNGNTVTTAARAARVPLSKLREWVRLGFTQPNSPCGELVCLLDQAAALAEASAVSRLYNGKSGWRSSLQYLNTIRGAKYLSNPAHSKLDILESEAQTADHHEREREKVPIDLDKAALVMTLIEAATVEAETTDVADDDDDIEPAKSA